MILKYPLQGEMLPLKMCQATEGRTISSCLSAVACGHFSVSPKLHSGVPSLGKSWRSDLEIQIVFLKLLVSSEKFASKLELLTLFISRTFLMYISNI